MANYIDGFLVPVPRDKLAEYKKISRKCGKIWMEYGALQYIETVADDVKPGKWTSFPQAVKLKDDEVVIFSYIVYKSRKQRDTINKKVFEDPRMNAIVSPDAMPFDGKRMIFGGFSTIVSL